MEETERDLRQATNRLIEAEKECVYKALATNLPPPPTNAQAIAIEQLKAADDFES